MILVLCAAAAGLLAYRSWQSLTWIPGIAALLVLIQASAAERAHAEALASGLTGGSITYWQWPCTLALFFGTALLLVAPVVRAAQRSGTGVSNLPAAAEAASVEGMRGLLS